MDSQQVKVVEAKYQILAGRFDEATLRLWAAAEARSLGRGGVSLVAWTVGVSRTTIHAGLAEIEQAGGRAAAPAGRCCMDRPGGGVGWWKR
jgi:hypothetical protein